MPDWTFGVLQTPSSKPASRPPEILRDRIAELAELLFRIKEVYGNL